MEAAADGAPAWEALRDIVPFHAVAPKLDDEGILFGRPLALLFRRGLGRVRRHAALPASAPGTGPELRAGGCPKPAAAETLCPVALDGVSTGDWAAAGLMEIVCSISCVIPFRGLRCCVAGCAGAAHRAPARRRRRRTSSLGWDAGGKTREGRGWTGFVLRKQLRRRVGPCERPLTKRTVHHAATE